MSRTSRSVVASIAVLAVISVTMTSAVADPTAPARPPAALARIDAGDQPSRHAATKARALAGKVIVIDPGHQLGNSSHPAQINRMVNAGGFMKACNTTGTATNAGFPEATFTWRVGNSLRRQLERRGAKVYLTRKANSRDRWGPCIDTRGRKGNRVHADAVVSIHGDGAAASTRGFFVIMPSNRRGWTDDIHRSSHRLGLKVRAGLRAAGVRTSSSYGGDGLDVRGDLGTLNWSNRPIVMVELGNMRNAVDAKHMTTPAYRREHYARGLLIGIKRFVLRR